MKVVSMELPEMGDIRRRVEEFRARAKEKGLVEVGLGEEGEGRFSITRWMCRLTVEFRFSEKDWESQLKIEKI